MTPSDADTPHEKQYGDDIDYEPSGTHADAYIDGWNAALDATRAAPGLRTALWQCGVESGMDTDGDDGPGALIAGMGDEGFASAMVEEVRRLRLAYDECLAQPEAGIDVQQVLAETLHEMQCRRRHPHPWDHSYSMMAGQLARALSAARLTAPGKSA